MLREELALDERTPGAEAGVTCAPPCLGDACRQRIFRQAQALLRDREEVEDVVQEVCLRCLLGQHRMRAGANIRTWRHRAVLRACKAAQQQHRVGVISAEPASSRSAFETAFRGAQTVPGTPEAERVVDTVRAALQRLTPRQRRLLEWRYLEGDSFAEIAQRLGIAEASARPAVHRARRAFKLAYAAAA